jgi:hypothetical protein
MADVTRAGAGAAPRSTPRGIGSSRASESGPEVDVALDEEAALDFDHDVAASDEREVEAQSGRGVCPVGFCPIGVALSAVQGARPDAVEHLLAAGREFLLAARAVIDARTGESGASSTLERIEIE